MKIAAVITDVLPKDCGECEIYLETPHLTVCGATKRVTCGGWDGKCPEWCPLVTAEQYALNVHLVTELKYENLTPDEWNANLKGIQALYAEGVKNDKINWDWLNGVERGRE